MMGRWYGNGRLRLAAALVAVLLASTARAGTEPADTVAELHAALLDVMRDAESLGFEGRRDRIEPVIERSFDLRYVARLLVRASWAGLEEDRRERMRAVFAALTVATYADRFDGYSGQTFVTTDEREVRGGRRLVRTELRTPGEDAVRIDYLLHRRDEAWRIVNVIADGVSELALKKTEYASVIRGQGFDALLEQLEAQVRDLETEAAT